MDSLEQQAIGLQANAPAPPDTFARIDSTPDATADGAAKTDSTGGFERPNQSNQDLDAAMVSAPPDLKKAYDNLLKADQRKWNEYQQQVQQFNQERQQYQMLLQQAMQTPHNAQQAQEKATAQGILDRIPPHIRETMAPEAKTVLETLGTVVQDEVESRLASIKQSQNPEVQALKQQLEAMQNQMRSQSWQAQAQSAVAKYGQQAVSQHANSIVQVLNAMPNLNVEQAIAIAAPQLIQEYGMRMGMQQALAQNKNQMFSQFANNSPSPSSSPVPAFVHGEDMMTSAAKVLGGL